MASLIGKSVKAAVYWGATAVAGAAQAVVRATEASGPISENRAAADVQECLDAVSVRFFDGVGWVTESAASASTHVASMISDAAPEAGAAASGLKKGIGDAAAGLVATMTVTDTDFRRVRREIKEETNAFPKAFAEWRVAARGMSGATPRGLVADVLTVGGLSLAAVSAMETIPEEILRAYKLAYPRESEVVPLAEKISQLDSPEALRGLHSALQGKLAETTYLDWLNAGNLPEGFTAHLAQSANNPGWDIRVVDMMGEIHQLLNTKATESLSYVLQGIHKYPDVDFATWPHVQAELALRGYSEGVVSMPINEESMRELLGEAYDAIDASDLLFGSVFGIAVAALTSYNSKDLNSEEKARQFGERIGTSKVSVGIGVAVVAMTGVGLLGVAGAVGASMLALWGGTKRLKLTELESLRDATRIARARRAEEAKRLRAIAG